MRTTLLFAAVLTLLLSVSAGCGGPDREKQLLQAERIARAEMADALKDDVDDGHGPYKVDSVQCTHEGDGQFTCAATADRSYNDGPNGSTSDVTFVGVIVTCDETSCNGRRIR